MVQKPESVARQGRSSFVLRIAVLSFLALVSLAGWVFRFGIAFQVWGGCPGFGESASEFGPSEAAQ